MNTLKHSDHKPSPIFKNLEILLLPTSIGKKRIFVFESQILKEGGALCSLNHAKSGQRHPTHVVVEDSLLSNQINLDKVLGPLGNVAGVVVGTRWLSDSFKLRKCMPTTNYQPCKKSIEGASSSTEVGGCSPGKKLKLSSGEVSSDTHLQCETQPDKVEVNASIERNNV